MKLGWSWSSGLILLFVAGGCKKENTFVGTWTTDSFLQDKVPTHSTETFREDGTYLGVSELGEPGGKAKIIVREEGRWQIPREGELKVTLHHLGYDVISNRPAADVAKSKARLDNSVPASLKEVNSSPPAKITWVTEDRFRFKLHGHEIVYQRKK